MGSSRKLLPGTSAEVLLALAARRLLSAALASGRKSTQVPSLGALSALANEAMSLSKAEEDDVADTFNSVAGLFGLDLPATDLFMLSLAMELDERIYTAALHLTGTLFGSPGPRIGSWLAILYPQLTERSIAFNALLNNAPLTRYKLVRILGAETAPISQRELCGEPSLLGHVLKGLEPALPEPLVGLAERVFPPDGEEISPETVLSPAFWELLAFMLHGKGPMRVLHLHPLPSRAAVPLVRMIAARLKRALIVLDLKTIEDGEIDLPVAVALREARLHGSIPVFLNAMSTGDEEPNQRRLQRVAQRWRRALALEQEMVIFATEGRESNEIQLLEQVGIDVASCELEPITLEQRRRLFQAGLERARTGKIAGQPPVAVSRQISVEQLASMYRVGVGDVDAIIHHATVSALLRARGADAMNGNGSNGQATILPGDMWKAAKERTRRDLGKFARRVSCRYSWEDLVLPADVMERLHDLYTAALHRARVYEDWGYGRKHVRGRGLLALFSGESGTGKTMSAEVLAQSLNVDLYQVDISAVVSKWIGETERNLSQIFDATEGSDAILFFDEADALFGKRTEVKESKDRYANMEVSYLLQRVESYDGIVILSSNLRSHIDEAFLRRFQFGITFPKPDEEARLALWKQVFPEETPVKGLDLGLLAHRYDQLTGGQIRLIAVGAAMLAAGENSPVSMSHIARSYNNEMTKMQRLVWENLR